MFLALIGPRLAYRFTGWGARFIYRALDPLRARSEAQCRSALREYVAPADVPALAEESFVHRARNLTDLMLASYLLRASTYERYGGRIPEPYLGALLEGQRRRQPTILITAYYGSFDLLPIFLGYNAVQAAVVYLPHSNPGFDAYRCRIRRQSGCEMVPLQNAAVRLGQVLGQGGTVGILADQHAEKRGLPVTFLGLPTKAPPSIGLLAWRYEADVVVAGIRRLGASFRFQWIVTDVVNHRETAAQPDAVEFVTHRYLRAIERLILEDPTQYLWAHARWGEEHARRSAAAVPSAGTAAESGPSASRRRIGDGQTEIEG
jgi:lauroyl/myristoyl acyltransferase